MGAFKKQEIENYGMEFLERNFKGILNRSETLIDLRFPKLGKRVVKNNGVGVKNGK